MGLSIEEDCAAKPKFASSQELLSLTTWGRKLKKVMKDSLVNREIRLQLSFQLKVTLLVKKKKFFLIIKIT